MQPKLLGYYEDMKNETIAEEMKRLEKISDEREPTDAECARYEELWQVANAPTASAKARLWARLAPPPASECPHPQCQGGWLVGGGDPQFDGPCPLCGGSITCELCEHVIDARVRALAQQTANRVGASRVCGCDTLRTRMNRAVIHKVF